MISGQKQINCFVSAIKMHGSSWQADLDDADLDDAQEIHKQIPN